MKYTRFLAIAALLTTNASAFLGGGKPLTLALAADMTGAKTHPNYTQNAAIAIESTLRLTQQNDIIHLYRICSYVEPVATIKISKTPKTPADLKARNEEFKGYAKAVTRPCKGGGSAITEALKQMSKNNVLVLFSDGGLTDDPQSKTFSKVAAGLNNKAAWFAGLSGQKSGTSSIRHTLTQKLAKTQHTVTSGHIDLSNGFERFKALVKAARK